MAAQRMAPVTGEGEVAARLRSAFERSHNPMLLADDQRRWIAGNPAAGELLRTPLQEIPWRTMDDFTPPREHDALDAQWSRFLRSGAAEGIYYLHVPEHDAIRLEFSAVAHVQPSRHLAVFMRLEDVGVFDDAQIARSEAQWNAITTAATTPPLTGREREMISLVALGLQSGEIARRLFLSPETVKSHMHNAMEKLGAHTRARAVVIALIAGEIQLADVAGSQ